MKKIFLFAAVLAMGVTGCMKDNTGTGVDGTSVNGPAGNLSIQFAVPNVAKTRVDQIASAGEWEIGTVSVYLFDKNGVALTTPANGFTKINVTSDNFTMTPDPATQTTVYKLKADKLIKTLSGDAKIYVAVNLPTGLDHAYATDVAMGEAFETVANLSQTGKFVMVSEAKEVKLLPSTVDAPVTTPASFVIGRVAAKVVATSTAATYSSTWTTAGVTLTYAIKEYNVYNEAIDSYLLKGTSTKSTLNDFATSFAKGNKTVTTAVDYTAGANAAQLAGLTNGYYIGENDSSVANLKISTTYAFVATTIALDKTAVWNATTKKVEWTGAAFDPTAANAVLYVIPNGVETYLASGTAAADAIANAMGVQAVADDPATPGDETVAAVPLKYFVYTAGYVHFPVFLNPDNIYPAEPNNYIIGRNEFIHLKVTNIKFIDGKFLGYPGDPTDPTKPIDPKEEVPNNPDPWEDDETVDPLPSDLEVTFEAKPWLYVENSVILER